MMDVASALSRRNKARLKELSDKKKANAAMRRVQERHGDILAKEDEAESPKAPKYSQEYLNLKSAYETAIETGNKKEASRIYPLMKAAKRKN